MSSKVAIALYAIVFVLAAGAFYSLPFFINKEQIKQEIANSFKAATGLDLEIEGEATIERFPLPHVTMNSMYVHNAQGASSQFLLTIKLAQIWPSLKSIFTKHITISKIQFDDVRVEPEHMKNDQMNWVNNNPSQVPIAPGDAGGVSHMFDGTHIIFTNTYLRYTDAINSSAYEFKDIRLDFLNGGAKSESALNMTLQFRDKALAVTGKIGSLQHAWSIGEVPANLTVSSGQSSLVYSGNTGFKEGKIVINGKVKLVTEDIVTWISTLTGATDKQSFVPGNYKLLPLQAESDITSDNGKITFPNVTLEGAIIKGGAVVQVTPPYLFEVKAKLTTLDLETLFESKLFALREIIDPFKDAAAARENTFLITPKSFVNSLNLTADVSIEDIIYNQQHIKGFRSNLDMAEGDMTISQASAQLPGDTRVIFAGIGKEGYQGFTLEGQVDATGASFADAIKMLKSNGISIPQEDFKRFRLRANSVISSKEFRLSEITARIENMAFVGGFIATFGDRIKLQAALRIGGANLDHFIRLWGLEEWRASFVESAPGTRKETFMSRWLKRLDYDSAMNISMEQFILNDVQRDRLDFKLESTTGKISLDDIKTKYNGTQLSGSVALDVMGSLPRLEIKATADTIDVDTFFAGSPGAKPLGAVGPMPLKAQPANIAPEDRWSRRQFDFHWLEILTASFHIKIGEFKNGLLNARTLDILGNIDNHTLVIDAMTGSIMNAQVALKGNIIGGRIPSINLLANITSLDTNEVVSIFPVLQGMTGKYNLSLKLDASGIDLYSWISSLEGSVGVGGHDIYVHGFNLPGVIRSVSYVRTVADILNVVKRAFPGGDTLFSSVEGQWTVASGIFKTSNTRLANDQAVAVLSSQVDFVNWRTQSTISFALRSLDPVRPPGMVISLIGNLDKPDVAIDTRSLEQYVTNRTSEKMLQQYGQ